MGAYFGRLILGIFGIISGSILVAKIIKRANEFNSDSIFLLILSVCILLSGIIAFILGIKSRKKYETQKKEIEAKAGKEIGFWGFKDK